MIPIGVSVGPGVCSAWVGVVVAVAVPVGVGVSVGDAGKLVVVGVGVIVRDGVELGVVVRVGTFGTQRDWPAKIRVELPRQLADWRAATVTPNAWLKPKRVSFG